MIRKQAITEHSVKDNPSPFHLQKEKEKKQTNKQNAGKVKKKCKWIINN